MSYLWKGETEMIVECAYCHAPIDTEEDDFIYDPEKERYFDSADCYVQRLFNEDRLEIYEDGRFWSEGYMGVEGEI